MGSEMTTGNETFSRGPGELNEGERAAIFSTANVPRHGAWYRRGAGYRKPSKIVSWTVAAFLVLGLGGQVAQHFFQAPGEGTRVARTAPVLRGTPTTNPGLPALISLQVFMGLKEISVAVAPTFTLRTQRGHRWRLASHRGRVVVLAFYNSICNDICPVVGAELRLASHELGAAASKVDFVVVNTDPNATKISPRSLALLTPGLSTDSKVTLLSGPTAVLSRIWSAYGVQVTVGAKKYQVSHNNVLYFIGPGGNLSAYAQPFGLESSSGLYRLNRSSLRTYAQGIAGTADSLVR